MRNLVGLGLGLVFAAAAAACGTGGTTGNDTPDASSSGNPDAAPSADLAPPPAGQGFQLKSPEITLQPGEEQTYCWYTTVPLTAATGVKLWESRMTPGSHHLIVFMTQNAIKPDGTLEPNCGLSGGGGLNSLPIWSYSAQTEEQQAPMPDGVGMAINANQHLYVQMHYLNTSDQDLKVHVTINGWTFPAGTSFMKAQAFVSYNTQIDIPAGVGMKASATGTCSNVPKGVNFFALSTHSHRRSVETKVFDGSNQILDSTDWQHPTIKSYLTDAPTWKFYQFQNSLTYTCNYVNDLNQEVVQGDSAATNEMCMAVGYFFPADQPVFCFN